MLRSLREFSKLAGVSPSTVSRVFSGTGRVAPETQQRIRELAQSLNFSPSTIGRVAFGGQTQSVGVMVPTLAVSFYAEIMRGLQYHLLKSDFLPIILQSCESGDSDQHAIQRLLNHRVDALFLTLASERLTPDDLGMVLRSQVPVVFLGTNRASLAMDAVDNDDVAGGRAVGDHLLSLGHRRFGFVYFGEGHSNSDLRLNGFREALVRTGVLLDDRDIAHLHPYNPNRDELLRNDLIAMLSRADRPTAIFASADPLARAVYLVARELKMQIPRDLSIVGYANLSYSDLIDPPLTTVDQNPMEIGRRSAKLILHRLKKADAPFRMELVPTQLIVRGSTGPVPVV
ncbi:MAG: LacI family DNA-binding transcriptional regulator [Phycisphaerales bacterium]|nr:LacI family DNA-binding transcriptional regulator [Phycisphaerales bacterium]